MSTEQSPLLGDQPRHGADSFQNALPSEDIYNRFSKTQKRRILAIVSLNGLFFMFTGACFVPSIPQISSDLKATPAAVSLGVSLSILATSFGVMFWSGYSSYYGRRVIYLCGMPFTILASFAVAMSTDINSLLLWRFVQTFGCSGSFALAAASIGDIYKLEERGTAMGTFAGAALFGLALAPPVGGAVAQFWSWRGFQAVLGVWSMIQMLLIAFFFPETAHPGSLGVDNEQGSKNPNIMAVTLANTFALASDYVLLVPIAYTIGAKYGITSEAMIGALFLPSGFGNGIGAPIAGRISDMVVRQARERRNGVWIPEDRLRATWLGGLVLIPISVTLAGFATTYISGTVGLVISLMCLFANGMGVDMMLAPIGAYTIDIMPVRSTEIMAATAAFRSLLLAPATGLLVPSIATIGVAATNTISGVLVLFGYFLIWLTIRYGKQMRAYVDVGYPNFDAKSSNGGTVSVEN